MISGVALLSSAKAISQIHLGLSDVDLLRLVNAVSLACHKATKLETKLEEVLGLIAMSLGWPVGHLFFARDEDGTDEVILESSRIWYLADPKLHREFRRVSEAFRPSAKSMPLAPQWLVLLI